MRTAFAILSTVFLLCADAGAQRDAPVWESYLASTTITHGKAANLNLDLLFKKEGGPHEHTEHQMYLLAYLQKDEAEVLKVASDKKLLNKKAKGKKLFLDVLLERRLATVLQTKVSKRGEFAAQDTKGKHRDGSDQGKAGLKRNAFAFRFTLKNKALFEAASKLAGFDKTNFVSSDHKYFNDMVKFLVFVPVNNCKYATKVSKTLREKHDFAHYDTTLKSDYLTTPKLYCKPLPFVLQFKKIDEGRFLVYIN